MSGAALRGMKLVLSLSMRCNTTASLRASATRAFLGPARLAIASAQVLRSEPLGRLVERGSHAHITDLRDAATIVGLARLILRALGDALRTGPTFTNVNDFRAIVIDPDGGRI